MEAIIDFLTRTKQFEQPTYTASQQEFQDFLDGCTHLRKAVVEHAKQNSEFGYQDQKVQTSQAGLEKRLLGCARYLYEKQLYHNETAMEAFAWLVASITIFSSGSNVYFENGKYLVIDTKLEHFFSTQKVSPLFKDSLRAMIRLRQINYNMSAAHPGTAILLTTGPEARSYKVEADKIQNLFMQSRTLNPLFKTCIRSFSTGRLNRRADFIIQPEVFPAPQQITAPPALPITQPVPPPAAAASPISDRDYVALALQGSELAGLITDNCYAANFEHAKDIVINQNFPFSFYTPPNEGTYVCVVHRNVDHPNYPFAETFKKHQPSAVKLRKYMEDTYQKQQKNIKAAQPAQVVKPPQPPAIPKKPDQFVFVEPASERGRDQSSAAAPLLNQVHQIAPEFTNDALLKAQFLEAHDELFTQSKSACFGWFRKTSIKQDMGLDGILAHAQSGSNRSRKVMKNLGWIDEAGQLTKEMRNRLERRSN